MEKREKKLREAIVIKISQAIQKRIFPGCVVGIVRKDGWRMVLPFGFFIYTSHASPIQNDTIYDIASVTKAIPTSCLALKLIEEKRLSLKDPLILYVPDYVGSFREEITLLHLLTQTLSFPFHLSAFSDRPPEEIIAAIMHARLFERPGKCYGSSNSTSILLGLMIEKSTGKRLDELAKEYFFDPLGMTKTTFYPDYISVKNIAPTESIEGEIVQGVVHDEGARVLSSQMTVGSAGVFSTADDLLTFLQMLLSEGSYREKRYFQKASVAKMYAPMIVEGKAVGLGWEMEETWMGKSHGKKTIGKTGFTGCSVLCDFEVGVGIVFLSNSTFPNRRNDRTLLQSTRAKVMDIVLSSFET